MSKELWFAEMERHLANGMSYDRACETAHHTYMERLYDAADNARKRAKEEPHPIGDTE